MIGMATNRFCVPEVSQSTLKERCEHAAHCGASQDDLKGSKSSWCPAGVPLETCETEHQPHLAALKSTTETEFHHSASTHLLQGVGLFAFLINTRQPWAPGKFS